MKKYGKYEKRPEGVPAPAPKQSKKMKNALLQTYITSLLCMVLCVTMFFGTSFAWFTSEVTNRGNEIYIGTLDVDLLLGDKSLNSSNDKVFENTIHWEPGYTALRDLSVKNEGDLAFNYKLDFIADPADSVESIIDAAKWFDVWVYSNPDNTAYSKSVGETFTQMTQKEGWKRVGTLADILKGEPVFTGSMTTADVLGTDGQIINTTHTYTVALHMNENAVNTKDDTTGLNTLMGKSISLNVKLIAYQMASEQDDLGGKYDQMVATEEELKEAIANGGTIALAADIDMADQTLTIAKDTVLDLNGYVLSGSCKSDQAHLIMVNNGASLNIMDTSAENDGKILYAKGDSDTGWAIDVEGELNLYSGTIELTGGPWNIGYAVDVRPNAWGTNYAEDTVFRMYGGKIVSSDGAVRVASSSSDSYGNIVASFIMDGGEIDAAWDGIFVQQSNASYDTLNVTINGGKIASDLAPIRIYGPDATSVNAGTEKPMTITINGGELSLTKTSDGTRTWYIDDQIMYGGGMSKKNLEQYTAFSIAQP